MRIEVQTYNLKKLSSVLFFSSTVNQWKEKAQMDQSQDVTGATLPMCIYHFMVFHNQGPDGSGHVDIAQIVIVKLSLFPVGNFQRSKFEYFQSYLHFDLMRIRWDHGEIWDRRSNDGDLAN